MLINAGCRAYIGTLWSIKNRTAAEAAGIFYGGLFDGNVLDSFFMMVHSIDDERDANIYLFFGLHFTALCRPKISSKDRIFKELSKSLSLFIEYMNQTHSLELRKNAFKIARFATAELGASLASNDLMILNGDVVYSQEKPICLMEPESGEEEYIRSGVLDLEPTE